VRRGADPLICTSRDGPLSSQALTSRSSGVRYRFGGSSSATSFDRSLLKEGRDKRVIARVIASLRDPSAIYGDDHYLPVTRTRYEEGRGMRVERGRLMGG